MRPSLRARASRMFLEPERAARAVMLCASLCVSACATPTERYARRAATLGFETIRLDGTAFSHRAYLAGTATPDALLHVYIEHDGTPWERPDRFAADPTPRRPLALELMARDTAPRILLGRPCHLGGPDPRCDPMLWTHARYSQPVVDSMTAALRNHLASRPLPRIVLIGYSGGGTIARLMAAELPQVSRVITLAANLDIDLWADLNGYSRLEGSLNPATQPALGPGVTEHHYAGTRDTRVPPSVQRAYAQRHPHAVVTEITGFDHVCCWIEQWPELLRRALAP